MSPADQRQALSHHQREPTRMAPILGKRRQVYSITSFDELLLNYLGFDRPLSLSRRPVYRE